MVFVFELLVFIGVVVVVEVVFFWYCFDNGVELFWIVCGDVDVDFVDEFG